MIRVALVEPEIPPNTGNVARLCAATTVPLAYRRGHWFSSGRSSSAAGRVGLLAGSRCSQKHPNLEHLYQSLPDTRFLYLTTKADKNYADWEFHARRLSGFRKRNPWLTRTGFARQIGSRCLTIPIRNPKVRSLNLATAVGIVLYEALQQTGAFSS